MKTGFFSKMYLVVIMTAMIFTSCMSDVELPGTGQVLDEPDGEIVNLGEVNENVRAMRVTFVKQNFTLTDYSGNSFDATGLLEIHYYVNSDGLIPTGNYQYTTDESKSAYTFDSAIVSLVTLRDDNEFISEEIIEGAVEVTYFGDSNYSFDFDTRLNSGYALNGKFIGKMRYSDDF